MTLTIVGLGPGAVDDLSRRAWRALKAATTIYLRTSQHGCVECLPQTGQTYHSFDALYESQVSAEQIYSAIVERVLASARDADVVYAVPGDALVGESTVARLWAAARLAEIPVEIVNGISFIEPTLAALAVDALEGLQIFDGIDIAAMHHPPLNPDYPALIGQVASRAVAAELKRVLGNQYPAQFPVKLVHGAGTDAVIVEETSLDEIDRSDSIRHMTALFVPALGAMASFEQFQEIIAHLRAPEGCPWDRKQTHLSLRQFLLEETYEVLEALDAEDPQALCEELGDLLVQVVLHAQIAIDDGEFTMADVLRHVSAKMVRRHPHVWGAVAVENAEQVVTNWEALKEQEHEEKGSRRASLLDGVPQGLPALLYAYRLQEKAARPGFDWDNSEDVLAKVREELDELAAVTDATQRVEEFGDLLFALVNWARWQGVEPESALRAANAKFYRRFRYIEATVADREKALHEHTLAELDALWNEAKRNEI